MEASPSIYMLDLLIVGAGPAGLTAALYARRAEKSVLVLEKSTFGGQMTFSPKIENYPGFLQLSGNELADKMVDQVLAQGALVDLDTVTGLQKIEGGWRVQGESGQYEARAVILATGAKHRMLGLEREAEMVGKGVSFCAVCDGAFYRGRDVAVIGGGNSALQEALLLCEGCRKVYLVQNLADFTGEQALLEKLKGKSNVELITSTVVESLIGNEELSGLVLVNDKGEKRTLDVDGMFVAIGLAPCNDAFRDVVTLNRYGYIEADETCTTGAEGVFTAGDCRSKSVRQIATAVADGAAAALAACRYLDK